MTETSPQRSNVLAQWGARHEDPSAVAARTIATLAAVRALGEGWTAPLSTAGELITDADVEQAIRAQALTDDIGTDLSHLGCQPNFLIGELSDDTTSPDHAALKITSSAVATTSGVPASSALLVAQGSTFVTPLLAHALSVTASLSDIWSAAAASLRDMALMRAEATAPRHIGYPMWGYVAWLSAGVFDGGPVDGASTTAVGGGTLLVMNDRTAEATARVWSALLAAGRLSRIA